MRLAIDFENQSGLRAIEIDDVGPDDMLTAKFKTGKTAVAQSAPENLFGRGHLATQSAGTAFE
jgi:hypothetical protein